MRNTSSTCRFILPASLALVFAVSACSGGSAPAGGQASDATSAANVADVAAAPDAAPASPADPMNAQLAELGGGMHALAEACGGYTAAQLEAMKAEQRDQGIQRGVSGEDFDAGFARGYADASAKIAAAGAQEREKSCAQAEQLRQMGAMQPQ